MPNIIIETSRDNLVRRPDTLLARINDTLWQSGQFKKPEDIKARLYHPNHTLIGLSSGCAHDFIVVHFYLMPGRDDVTIQKLADSIAAAIKTHLTEFEDHAAIGQLQICVNPMELSKNYVKQTL